MIRFNDVFAPDGDEARRLAEEELARTRYAEAQPTWFDLLARDVLNWILGLFQGGTGAGAGPVALIVVCVVVVAALVVSLIVWGRPRRTHATRRVRRDLLGVDDDRTAAQLRSDAERRARSGEWDEATVLRYRALAKGLLERDLISPAPGATAQAIAREAAGVFVDEAGALGAAASAFDDVRYLEHPSDERAYRLIADADDRLRSRTLSEATA